MEAGNASKAAASKSAVARLSTAAKSPGRRSIVCKDVALTLHWRHEKTHRLAPVDEHILEHGDK